jgi:sec-independent protein translocase protein TatA
MGSRPYIGPCSVDLRAARRIPDGRAVATLRVSLRGPDTDAMTLAFIAGLGPLELAIILLIVLVIVGGKRLPQLGRQLGGGVKEFKDSVTSRTDKQWADDGGDERAEVQAALGRPEHETEPLDGEVVRERET